MDSKKKWDAVIFDLDGTLLNTLEDIADSMNNVLKKHSFPLHSYEDYKFLVGRGVEQLVISSLPHDLQSNQDLIHTAIQEMSKEYEGNWKNKSKPYPEILSLLAELKKRNVRTAVLSNKKDNFTKKSTKALLPGITFDIIWGAHEGIPHKPDPSSALKIADLFSLQPEQLLYLGDTDVDMQTAAAAGMYAVGAGWGFRPVEELLAHGARAIIFHPLELLSFF